MAQQTNEDTLGKPIEAVTRAPVKRFDNSASNKALVAGAEQLAKLGLQADQAFAKSKLKGDINNTLEAYEQVQGYARGESVNLFTGDTDVDNAIKGMVGEMDDVREAVRQGVMLPELGKARLETVLKNAKARRPSYADQLNAVAADVLGFNPSGWAAKKLFTADAEPKLSDQQKLRNKMLEDSRMLLWSRGMGEQALYVPDDVAINTASKLKEAEAKTEQLLTNFKIEGEEQNQVNRSTRKIASTWGNLAVDKQLAGFAASLASAPEDPEARAAWEKENVPRAIANLQQMRSGLTSSFIEQVRMLHGDEAAATLDATTVAEAIKPVQDRLDQMIEDFQDPVLLASYERSLELDMAGLRHKFIDQSPYARRYLALFSGGEGRDAALLDQTLSGVLSKQILGTKYAGEFDNYIGIVPTNASDKNSNTSKVVEFANYVFDAIRGVEEPEEAQQVFNDFVSTGKEQPWFDADIGSPAEQVKAANSFAIRAFGNLQDVLSGAVPDANAPQALSSMKSAINGMITHPPQEQVVEIPSTAALYNQLNSPDVYAAEEKYGVSFAEEREVLKNRLRTNVDDRRSVYSDSIDNNYKVVSSPVNDTAVEVRPLNYTNFVFNSSTGNITASPDRNGINKRISGMGVHSRGSTANAVRDAYLAPSQSFNNDNAAYSNGVGALFFSTYNEIKARDGSVDLTNDAVVQDLVSTGIMKDLGYVDQDFEMEVAEWRRAMVNDPTIVPDAEATPAMQLAYQWSNSPQLLARPTAGMSIQQQAATLTSLYSAAWFKQLVNDGSFRFN